MTREFLDAQLGRLIPLKGMPHNSDGYWDALNDIEGEVIEQAMTQALKSRVFFPTPAEVRMDCDQVAPRRLDGDTVYLPRQAPDAFTATIRNPFTGVEHPVTVGLVWEDECMHCRDTGWTERFCGGPESRRDPRECGRFGNRVCQYPHTYVIACLCIPTNKTIQRRREAARKYAQEPAKR